MPLREHLVGAGLLLVILALTGGGAALLVRRRFAHLTGAPRWLAGGMLWTLNLLVAHLVPGALGTLRRGSVLAGALLVLALCAALARRGAPRAPAATPSGPPEPAPERGLALLPAVAAAGVALVAAVAVVAQEWGHPVANGDSTTFHLTQAARWIQTRSLWGINNFSPDWSYGTEPNHGDLLQLAFVLPWRGDAFVRLPALAFLVLAALAAYAIARELGAPRGASVTFAALLAAMPIPLLITLDANLPDIVALATFGAGALFLLRHARAPRRSELVLAGIAFGLSFGTRWYGPPEIAAAIALWAAAAVFLARRPARRVALEGAGLTTIVVAVGGFWMLRNWVQLGNPLFPAKVGALGLTVFDAPPDPLRDQYGFSLAHYALQPDVWSGWIFPGFKLAFGYGLIVLVVGVALAAILAWRGRRAEPGLRCVLVAAAGAGILGLVYAMLPFTAQGPDGAPYLVLVSARYGSPALLVAAAVTAWAAGRLGRWGLLLQVAAVGVMVHAVLRLYPPYTTHASDLFAPRYVAYALALAGLIAGARLLLARRPAVAAGALIALLVLLVGLGHRHQRHFYPARYSGIDPTLEWVLAHARDHSRIALGGVSAPHADYSAPYPLHGPRLTNRVEYVGPTRAGKLERYGTRAAFLSALAAGRYDALLVGRFAGRRDVPEMTWARSVGWRPVADSGRYVMLTPPAGARR